MHIPENYLSPQTCAVMGAVMIPVWILSVKKVQTELPKEKISLIGIGAAFSFLGMMFNVPIPGGTTAHAVGGTLVASMLGPYAAGIAITMALLVQCLLFGDGGILCFGANCFNMAFVLPFVGYAVYRLISSRIKSEKAGLIGAAVGSYVGLNAAALCAAIEFGIQPLLFADQSGQALYCPYPLSVSVPAMMLTHLTIAGLAEIIYTLALYTFIVRCAPDLRWSSEGRIAGKSRKLTAGLLGLLILATPLGLLATGTAWGEWDSNEIAGVMTSGSTLGYTPSGLANGFSLSAVFPEYSISGFPGWFGYMLSALVGAAVLVIFFKLLTAGKKRKVQYS